VNKDVNSSWSGFAKVLSERGLDKGALRTRSPDDIRAVIADLAAAGIDEWRINQARQALRILYRDILQFDPRSMPPARHGV
jgi:hypothetical protein